VHRIPRHSVGKTFHHPEQQEQHVAMQTLASVSRGARTPTRCVTGDQRRQHGGECGSGGCSRARRTAKIGRVQGSAVDAPSVGRSVSFNYKTIVRAPRQSSNWLRSIFTIGPKVLKTASSFCVSNLRFCKTCLSTSTSTALGSKGGGM